MFLPCAQRCVLSCFITTFSTNASRNHTLIVGPERCRSVELFLSVCPATASSVCWSPHKVLTQEETRAHAQAHTYKGTCAQQHAHTQANVHTNTHTPAHTYTPTYKCNQIRPQEHTHTHSKQSNRAEVYISEHTGLSLLYLCLLSSDITVATGMSSGEETPHRTSDL